MKIKRSIIALILPLVALATVWLTCCGFNRDFFDTKWTFRTAYINLGGKYGTICVKVQKWKDYENSDCVQVTTPEGVTYVAHYANCVLCSSPNQLPMQTLPISQHFNQK